MKKEREKEILNLLIDQKKMDVVELSNILGVSQVTIRKDLDELERRHIVRRMHGYVMLNSEDDINGHIAYHYEDKIKIASKAAELVNDGDTIIIENGSCCALAALTIAQTKKNVTIVTNSAFIADYIRQEPSVKVVLLGGIYQQDSQCLVGDMVKDCVSYFNTSYCFIGTDGWDEKMGFTNKDFMRARAVRDLTSAAQETVILTESEKFHSAGTVSLNLTSEKIQIITDEHIPDNIKNKLASQNMKITIVED